MSRVLKIVIVASVASAALAALSVVAAADFLAKYDSTVSIHFETGEADAGNDFSGRVRSEWRRCETYRKVIVLRRADGPDERVGKDVTDTDGNWELTPTSVAAGTYYAKAKRKDVLDRRGYVRLCRWAISDEVQVPAPSRGQEQSAPD